MPAPLSYSQFFIIWADILIAPVFHAEPSGNRPKLSEPEPLVKVPSMNIVLYNSIELQDAESKSFSHI